MDAHVFACVAQKFALFFCAAARLRAQCAAKSTFARLGGLAVIINASCVQSIGLHPRAVSVFCAPDFALRPGPVLVRLAAGR
jgi:hypothetical protein